MRHGFEIVLVLFVFLHFGCSYSKKKLRIRHNMFNETHFIHRQEQASMKDLLPEVDYLEDLSLSYNKTKNLESTYSEWTKWSRCLNCLQRRMKSCLDSSCHNSRMYEERECNKKRCKRKNKKVSFHVVHLNASRNYLIKQAPSDVWSRWTKWSECSPDCRTFRMRRCKKPGRCRKQIQNEAAYCYHERTSCELWVLNLLEDKQRNSPLVPKYQYTYNNNQYITRESRMRRGKCGVSFSKPQMLRIIGGTEAQRYKWPWHVAILNQFMEVFCGGTLIASRWVLTASHCIRKQLKVRLNSHDLRSRDGSDIEMNVYQMFAHPRFEIKTVDNDIALLMLPRSVRTPVACLPNRRPKEGQLCSVMGWGKIHTDDMYGVPILHEAKLPLVTHKTCKRAYKEFLISSNMMCAGWKSGKSDTCAGDSGGGLMCPQKRAKKLIYSVQGITSFGDGCGGRNKYGIYTAVFNYNDWIRYIIDHY